MTSIKDYNPVNYPDRPLDVLARAEALSNLDVGTRSVICNVFKRVANIAKEADEQEAIDPVKLFPVGDSITKDQKIEQDLFNALTLLKQTINDVQTSKQYSLPLSVISDLASLLDVFFNSVFVMVDDDLLRNNRLRIMRDIHKNCLKIADFGLLTVKKDN